MILELIVLYYLEHRWGQENAGLVLFSWTWVRRNYLLPDQFEPIKEITVEYSFHTDNQTYRKKTAQSKLRNGYSPLNISKLWGMPSPTFHSNISFTFACPPSQYRHRSYTATVLPRTIVTAYIYVNSYQRNNNHYHLSLLFIILIIMIWNRLRISTLSRF